MTLVRNRKAMSPKESEVQGIVFQRPKILVIDLPGVSDGLRDLGYNVRAGTFGRPYRVAVADGYQPVVGESELPGYREQEVVFVNLAPREIAAGPDGQPAAALTSPAIWAPTDAGLIDPRPKLMARAKEDFDRIHEHGGAFVVFAAPRVPGRYVLAHKGPGYSGLRIDRYEDDLLHLDTWDFSRRSPPLIWAWSTM